MAIRRDQNSYGSIGVYEAFQIAIQVERNAAEFYRKAAAVYKNVRVANIFQELYQSESKHLESLVEMQKRFILHAWENGSYKPNKMEIPESLLMAGLAIFGIHPDPQDELCGSETCIQALDLAVSKEKDMVIYFTGLKGMLKYIAEQENLDELILDEMQHIRYLEQAIETLSTGHTGLEDWNQESAKIHCPKCGSLACSGNPH